jgi:hypothetical protein
MTDGEVPPEAREIVQRYRFGQEAQPLSTKDFLAVGDDDSGALLSAMLEGV